MTEAMRDLAGISSLTKHMSFPFLISVTLPTMRFRAPTFMSPPPKNQAWYRQNSGSNPGRSRAPRATHQQHRTNPSLCSRKSRPCDQRSVLFLLTPGTLLLLTAAIPIFRIDTVRVDEILGRLRNAPEESRWERPPASPQTQALRTSSNTVISGLAPKRMGKPMVPMPRLTYSWLPGFSNHPLR